MADELNPPRAAPATSPAAGGDIMKLFEGPTEESLTEAQRALVRRGREAFGELEKLIKNVALYGSDHQSVGRFRERFHQAIRELVDAEGVVDIKIGPYDFLIHEQSVYQNQTPERNFVYKFFQDGVRSLRFEQGLEPDELDGFLDVLLTNWDDPALFEDDAVTLMWEKDFTHIRYKVIDSFSEESERDAEGGYTVEAVIERVREGADEVVDQAAASAALADDLEFVGDGALGGGGVGRGIGRPVLSGAGVTERDLERFEERPFAMDEQEFAMLRHVYEAAADQTLEKFIEILFKVCLAEDGPAERDRLLGFFERIAELLLESGRLGDLERVMLKVRSLTGPPGELLLENVEAINQIFARWSTPALVSSLLDAYDDPRFERPGVVLAICRLLDPAAAVPLAREGGRLQIAERRQTLFEMLPELIGGRHVREIGRLLQTADSAHAHDLLRVLRRIDHPEVQGAVSAAFSNPDPAVRLAALSTVPVDRAHVYLRFIQSALNDSSKVVRSKALHLLARVRTPQVHNHLMQRLREKDFAQLDLDEKRKYFVAAALTGDPSAYFMELLEARGLFKRQANEELRACAAVGLAVRMHRPAIPLLQREAKRRLTADAVREACVWALQHMASDREERTRQIYDIIFQGTLSAAPRRPDRP